MSSINLVSSINLPTWYDDGAWCNDKHTNRMVNFNPMLGPIACKPVFLGELRNLPKMYPTLRVLGFFMYINHGKNEPPPFGSYLKVEGIGEIDGRRVRKSLTLFHQDGYEWTAIAGFSLLKQFFSGMLKKPGLWKMGEIADYTVLFSDMAALGVKSNFSQEYILYGDKTQNF